MRRRHTNFLSGKCLRRFRQNRLFILFLLLLGFLVWFVLLLLSTPLDDEIPAPTERVKITDYGKLKHSVSKKPANTNTNTLSPSTLSSYTSAPRKSRYKKDKADTTTTSTSSTSAPTTTQDPRLLPTEPVLSLSPERLDAPLVLRSPDLIKEDVFHTPFTNSLGYQSFAGLQLNAFTTTGVQIAMYERQWWESHQRDLKVLNETRQKAREVMPKLLRGDSLHNPLDMMLVTDRYFFLDNSPGNFRSALCRRFVDLIRIPNKPPLVVELFNTQVGRFVYYCVYSQREALEDAKRKFVLVGSPTMVDGEMEKALCEAEWQHAPASPSPLTSLAKLQHWSEDRIVRQRLLQTTLPNGELLPPGSPTGVCIRTALGGGRDIATSGFVDEPMLQSIPKMIAYLLNHTLLSHWYAVNGNLRHTRFTPLPMGYYMDHRSGRSLLPYAASRRRNEEQHSKQVVRHLLQGLDLQWVFANTTSHSFASSLHFGRQGVMWLEKGLEIFGDGAMETPAQWVPLHQLPERITTIYVVLTPVEREKRRKCPSLVSHALVFKENGGNKATAASQHVALLPFTAAVYHKLLQHPYGESDVRELKVLVIGNVLSHLPSPAPGAPELLYPYLQAHPELAHAVDEMGTEEWYTALNQFAFVACPLGLSYDSSCIWEALVFGAIPILMHPEAIQHLQQVALANPGNERADPTTTMMLQTAIALPSDFPVGKAVNPRFLLDVYKELPVIVVRRAEDMTLENMKGWRSSVLSKMNKTKEHYLKTRETKGSGVFNLEKLFLQYWVDKIHAH